MPNFVTVSLARRWTGKSKMLKFSWKFSWKDNWRDFVVALATSQESEAAKGTDSQENCNPKCSETWQFAYVYFTPPPIQSGLGRKGQFNFICLGWKEKSRVCMRNSEGLMSVWLGSDLVTLEATGVTARDGIRGISMGRNVSYGTHSADQYSISMKVPGREETGRSRECIWTMVKYLKAWKKMWTYKFKKLNAICDINFGCQLVGLQYPHKNSLLGASVRALQAGLTGMGRHTLIWAAQACTHTEKIYCFKNGWFQNISGIYIK